MSNCIPSSYNINYPTYYKESDLQPKKYTSFSSWCGSNFVHVDFEELKKDYKASKKEETDTSLNEMQAQKLVSQLESFYSDLENLKAKIDEQIHPFLSAMQLNAAVSFITRERINQSPELIDALNIAIDLLASFKDYGLSLLTLDPVRLAQAIPETPRIDTACRQSILQSKQGAVEIYLINVISMEMKCKELLKSFQ